MDPNIFSWILQFMAHQGHINFSITSLLSTTSPLPDDDILLKKRVILRIILNQIDDASITECILDYLEMVEEFDRLMGVSSVPDSMRQAYLAVALECTVRYLYGNTNNKGKYFDAIKRIWRTRIRIMEEAESALRSNLLTDDLLHWRTRLEAACHDQSDREEILSMNTRTDAFLSVRAYLEEAFQGLVPFLEACSRNYPTEQMCGSKSISSDPASPSDDIRERHEHNAPTETMEVKSHNSRGDENSDPTVLGKASSLSTPTIARAVDALQVSFMDLQAVVKDPLPDAIKVAESLVADKGYPDVNMEEDANATDATLKTNVENNAPTAPVESECRKRSLMERNSTARTYEWDELSETEEEEAKTRPYLPNLTTQVISPLRMYKPVKITRRRPIKWWSKVEEETLTEGVKKFGVGNWKIILDSYRDIFEDRTPGDLKDKWRRINGGI